MRGKGALTTTRLGSIQPPEMGGAEVLAGVFGVRLFGTLLVFGLGAFGKIPAKQGTKKRRQHKELYFETK